MLNPNRIAQFATQRFNQAIYSLRDGGVPPVSDIAKGVVSRINKRDVLVVLDTSLTQQTTTALRMIEVPQFLDRHLYIPSITLEAGRMLTFTQIPHRIEADLVRTLAIVNQTPDKGYQRRWRVVYGDALDIQAAWLNQVGSGPIDEDPRFFPREELIQKLLGQEQLGGDTGFEDWQSAIDELMADESTREERPLLQQLRGAAGHFMAVRERFAVQNYRIATTVNKNRFLALSDDERAKANAIVLVGQSIFARSDNPLN